MTDSFDADINSDLNDTFNAIEIALDTISDNIDSAMSSIEENNETKTDYDLDIAIDSDTNATFTVSTKDGVLISAINKESISIRGTGYDLDISTLTFSHDETTADKQLTAELNATANLEGDNNTRFNGTLTLSADINNIGEDSEPTASDVTKLSLSLSGILESNGRELDGSVTLDATNANYKIVGKLTGKTDEPIIDGELTANIKLLDLEKVNDDDSVDQIDFEDIPQSYTFIGKIVDGAKEFALELDYNKSTLSNDIDGTIKNLVFKNDKVSLTADQIDLSREVLSDTGSEVQNKDSLNIVGLSGTVIDDTNSTLSLKVDGNFSEEYSEYDSTLLSKYIKNAKFNLDTTYSYLDTDVNISIQSDLSDYKDGESYPTYGTNTSGFITISGSVRASDFEPFDIDLGAKLSNTTNKTEGLSILISKGSYKFATEILNSYSLTTIDGNTSYSEDPTTTIKIVDSNGVIVDGDTTTLNVTNSSGDSLGTIQNNEIKYSDGLTETLY